MQRRVGHPTIRTPENRERILYLLANGLGYAATASALGISYLFPPGRSEVDLSCPNLVIFALRALDRRRFDDAVAARCLAERDAALAASMPSEELQQKQARILELLEKAHLVGLARMPLADTAQRSEPNDL
jgi:hypothetical protein